MEDGVGWLALGGAAALQLVAGIVRARAWFHVIHHSCPDTADVRYRDVVLAHLGGVGWNAVLPAHGGDAVKVVLASRRMPRRRLALLASTLVPPALVEAAFTVLLVAGLIAMGLVTLDVVTSGLPAAGTALIVAALVCIAIVAALFLRRRLNELAHEVRAGLAVLGRPRIVATRIVPWLLAGRALRLIAFALVLTAAGVPFGLAPALALMALQGATPSAGAAATAARIALIAAVLAGTGAADVSATRVAEALAAAYGVTSLVNLAVSGAVIAVLLGTTSPKRIAAYVKSVRQHVKQSRSRRLAAPRPADGDRA